MVPLLRNHLSPQWEDVAWGYFNRGITLRTERYRLTKILPRPTAGCQLYITKPIRLKNKNVAEEHPEVVQQLMPLLEEKDFVVY